jgi:hypothetical protein
MDIKQQNIMVNMSGVWSLGDFDACVKFGERAVGCTHCYVPADVPVDRGSATIDWEMLLSMIAFIAAKEEANMDVATLLDASGRCDRSARDTVLSKLQHGMVPLVDSVRQQCASVRVQK